MKSFEISSLTNIEGTLKAGLDKILRKIQVKSSKFASYIIYVLINTSSHIYSIESGT